MVGLQPVDSNFAAMLGSGAPQLRAILQTDLRAYSAGDLLFDVPGTVDANGVQVARSPFSTGGPGLIYKPFVLIAVPAGMLRLPSFATVVSSVPASKSGVAYVWALPALARTFEIFGDGSMPIRSSEIQVTAAGRVPMSVTAQSINDGVLFADLTPGMLLDGTSFRTQPGNSWLSVVGLSSTNPAGNVIGPNAMYRVRLIDRS